MVPKAIRTQMNDRHLMNRNVTATVGLGGFVPVTPV